MNFQNCPFDVTPYDKSNLVKSPNIVSLNYTNQDFWSMKSRLIDFIKERFGDTFNDFIESDLAMMLIENWAFIADTLSFKMDQIANEVFIDTVTEVDNAFRLAMLVGFKPQPPLASRSMWSSTISNPLETDLIINTPVRVDINTEDGPRVIELFAADSHSEPVHNEPIIISSGSFINTNIIGLEGRTVNSSVAGTGEINQFIELSEAPVIWNSIKVNVDGMEWEQVDYFTDSQPRREFRVEHDPNYQAFLIFGNNRAGLIPSDGSTINVSYRVGGGPVGNIVTGSVDFQQNFIVPGFGFRVPVTFRNYTKGEFGYSGDTIEDIKKKLPVWLRTQNRIVSGSDYETFADQFVTEHHGQIGKSKAILRQHGCAANVIDLYILALEEESDLAEATSGLKNQLKEALDKKKMLTDHVCVRDGGVIEVDITVDLVLDRFYRKFEDEINERVDRRLSGFFKLNNWDYGKSLKSVDLIKQISDIKEIISVEMTFVSEEETGELVTSSYHEIIRPGTITYNFVYQ